MRNGNWIVPTVLVAAALAAVGGVASAAPYISWEMDPSMPDHLVNPGGTLTASCLVHTDDTTFERLEVRLLTPGGGTLAEWTVTDRNDLAISYTMPDNYPDGVYKYRMQYYSKERGLTVDVSEGFLAAGTTTGICAFKFEDVDGDGLYEPEDGEGLLAGWEICSTSGPQSLPCQTTSEDGVTCWFFITPGTYILCETLQDGWQNTTGLCDNVRIEAEEIGKVEFGNQFNPIPIEEKSWGQIKASFK